MTSVAPCKLARIHVLIGSVLKYCCYGYAMDLLVQLANSVNFTFDLHLVEDDTYGTYERVNCTQFSFITTIDFWVSAVNINVYGSLQKICSQPQL